MAHVTTTYKHALAESIGARTEAYEASTVKELLKQMEARHGKAVSKTASTLLITVNGLSIQSKQHYRTRLKEGDVVGFFPLAAGG
jgi:molybdopterin converting factor small subunit